MITKILSKFKKKSHKKVFKIFYSHNKKLKIQNSDISIYEPANQYKKILWFIHNFTNNNKHKINLFYTKESILDKYILKIIKNMISPYGNIFEI